jgi:hypothetical protein
MPKRRLRRAAIGVALTVALVAAQRDAHANDHISPLQHGSAKIVSIECLFDADACAGFVAAPLPPQSKTPQLHRVHGPRGGYVYEIEYLHYPVATGFGFTLPLGHAGVVAIDPSGTTKYFEYGRYSTNFGQVRRPRIPDVTIGADHWPTADSMANLYRFLSANVGKQSAVRATFHQGANYMRTISFAVGRQRDAHRRAYSWNPLNPNDCKSFVAEAIAAGVGALRFTVYDGHRVSLELFAIDGAPRQRQVDCRSRWMEAARFKTLVIADRTSDTERPARSPPSG